MAHFQPLSVRITGDTAYMVRKGSWLQTGFKWEVSQLSSILRSLFGSKFKSSILVSWKQRMVFLPVWKRRQALVWPPWWLECGTSVSSTYRFSETQLGWPFGSWLWFWWRPFSPDCSSWWKTPCPGSSKSLLFQDDGGHGAPGHCLNVILSELWREYSCIMVARKEQVCHLHLLNKTVKRLRTSYRMWDMIKDRIGSEHTELNWSWGCAHSMVSVQILV